jgi:hypothetical protein
VLARIGLETAVDERLSQFLIGVNMPARTSVAKTIAASDVSPVIATKSRWEERDARRVQAAEDARQRDVDEGSA